MSACALLAALVALAPSPAPADPAASAWAPRLVRVPVSLAQLDGRWPFVQGGADVRGPASIGPDGAAAFFLEAWGLARVRLVEPGSGAALRFVRVIGGPRPRAAEPAQSPGPTGLIEEMAIPVEPGVFYVRGAPGSGDVIAVTADRPAAILVERPALPTGRAVWDAAAERVARWIDAGGPPPALPAVVGGLELGLRLAADEELGRVLASLGGGDVAFVAAVRSWRIASASLALAAFRPLAEPAFDRLVVSPGVLDPKAALGDEPDEVEPRAAYRRIDEKGATIAAELPGGGLLRIEARRLFPAGPIAPAAPLFVRVRSRGRLLGERVFSALPQPRAVDGGAAFSPLETRAASTSEPVSRREAFVLPLLGEKAAYDIEVVGGPALLRIMAAYPRRRLAGSAPLLSYRAPAVPSGYTVGWRVLAALIGAAPGDADPGDADLDPAVAAALLARRCPDSATDAAKQVARFLALAPRLAGREAARSLAWQSRIDLARCVTRFPDPGLLARLLAWKDDPPSAAWLALGGIVPEPVAVTVQKSARLGALEIAAAAAPADPGVRAALAATWRETTTWASLEPSPVGGVGPVRRWLDVDRGPVESWEPRLHFPITVGTRRVFVLPASAAALALPAVLRVYVLVSGAPSPCGLRIDGTTHPAFCAGPVERLEVALSPGRHTLELHGPAGTTAFVAAIPADAEVVPDDRAARIRSFAAVRSGDSVRYRLPDPGVPGAALVQVRFPAARREVSSHEVLLHTDVGPVFRLDLGGAAADPDAHPLDGSPPATRTASFVLRLPPHTAELRLEARGLGETFAAVSLRQPRAPPTLPGQGRAAVPAAAPAGDPIERVAALSRAYAATPADPAPLVDRARLLFDLGARDLAREDLRRVARSEGAAERFRDAFAELAARLAAPWDDAFVPLRSFTGPGRPVPVSASFVAAGHGAAALATFAEARERSARGDWLAAARALLPLHRTTGAWQVGLEALGFLERAILEAPPKGRDAAIAATMAYGLAETLARQEEHPRIRRTLFAAAERTKLEPLSAAERHAGEEKAWIDEERAAPSPLLALRRALMPTPWSRRGEQVLPPGLGTVLDLDLRAPAKVRLDGFCQEIRRERETPEPCSLRAKVDRRPPFPIEIQPGAFAEHPLGVLDTGRHQIEVSHEGGGRGRLCAVRFVSDRKLPESAGEADGGHVAPSRRPVGFLLARRGRPVEALVEGPASLRIEARAVLDGHPAEKVGVSIAETRGGVALREEMVLSAAADPSIRTETPARPLAVAEERWVVLAEPGPHRITVEPVSGTVALRLALRVGDGRGPPAQESDDGFPETVGGRWPALPPPASVVEGSVVDVREPWAVGMLSARITAGRGDLDERDIDRSVRNRGALAVEWRRRLSPSPRFAEAAWVRLAPRVGIREEENATWGGSVALEIRGLPGKVGLGVGADAMVERVTSATAYRVSGDATLLRPFWLAPGFELVPSLRFGWRTSNVEPASAAGVDPDIFTAYDDAHDRALGPRLGALWQPLQDFEMAIAASARTNADLRTLDQVAGTLALRALLLPRRVSPVHLETRYRPNHRFADADRSRGFLRHDLSVRIAATIHAGRAGRLILGADEGLYLAAGARSYNVLLLWLRFDLAGGRGLFDVLPGEEPFADLVDPRFSEPAYR